MFQSTAAISTLRAFRLFRIFKLLRSWKSLQLILSAMKHCLYTSLGITLILFLFIFVFAVLGMQVRYGQTSL